jgi:hypothetical protein
MDFRKELAKELGLGAIAENTMLDDYVKACEAIAVRYHESEVKKFRLADVVGQSEQLPCRKCGDYGTIDNQEGTVSTCPCHY